MGMLKELVKLFGFDDLEAAAQELAEWKALMVRIADGMDDIKALLQRQEEREIGLSIKVKPVEVDFNG